MKIPCISTKQFLFWNTSKRQQFDIDQSGAYCVVINLTWNDMCWQSFYATIQQSKVVSIKWFDRKQSTVFVVLFRLLDHVCHVSILWKERCYGKSCGYRIWIMNKAEEKKIRRVLIKTYGKYNEIKRKFYEISENNSTLWRLLTKYMDGFNFIFYARAHFFFFNRRGKSEWSLKMSPMQTAELTI